MASSWIDNLSDLVGEWHCVPELKVELADMYKKGVQQSNRRTTTGMAGFEVSQLNEAFSLASRLLALFIITFWGKKC